MIPLLLMLAGADAIGPVCRGASIEAAIARYAATAKTMNPRRVAALYAADGILIGGGGEPYTGPAEIEAFLAGFGGYKLGEQMMRMEWVKDKGAGRFETGGVYLQSGSDPKGAPFKVDGNFHADWRCTKAGWRVERMRAGFRLMGE